MYNIITKYYLSIGDKYIKDITNFDVSNDIKDAHLFDDVDSAARIGELIGGDVLIYSYDITYDNCFIDIDEYRTWKKIESESKSLIGKFYDDDGVIRKVGKVLDTKYDAEDDRLIITVDCIDQSGTPTFNDTIEIRDIDQYNRFVRCIDESHKDTFIKLINKIYNNYQKLSLDVE